MFIGTLIILRHFKLRSDHVCCSLISNIHSNCKTIYGSFRGYEIVFSKIYNSSYNTLVFSTYNIIWHSVANVSSAYIRWHNTIYFFCIKCEDNYFRRQSWNLRINVASIIIIFYYQKQRFVNQKSGLYILHTYHLSYTMLSPQINICNYCSLSLSRGPIYAD